MNKTIEILKELEKNKNPRSLSKESTNFILIICRILKPKNILEIGTLHANTSLWFSLFAEKVITLEIDEGSVKQAKENIKKAECKNIEIIQGDAKENIKNLREKFDIILIDGKKEEYKTYLELSLNLLNKNGLIFADNTISHKEKLNDFFVYLKNSNLYYQELNIGKKSTHERISGLMIISQNLL